MFYTLDFLKQGLVVPNKSRNLSAILSKACHITVFWKDNFQQSQPMHSKQICAKGFAHDFVSQIQVFARD